MTSGMLVKAGSSGKRSSKRIKHVLKMQTRDGPGIISTTGRRLIVSEPKELKVEVDISAFTKKNFEDVHAIRSFVSEVFAPLNIKLISKRAERHYPNGYCVYVLYCNRCQKRKPTY